MKRGVVVWVCILAVFWAWSTAHAAGSGYCGVLTLAVNGAGVNMDFHIFDTGGPLKVVHGVFIPTPTANDPDYKPILFSGTGQVITTSSIPSPTFFINYTSTQDHAPKNNKRWRDGRVGQISLDLNSGTGEVYSIGVDRCEGSACTGAISDPEYGGGWLDPDYDTFSVSVVGNIPQCLNQ